MAEKNKRVCIVFEETDQFPGHFNVYLEGHDKAALEKLDPEEWPRAAFWAIKCFKIVTNAITSAGAVLSKQEKGKA